MNFFKGYIRINGKKPIEKFKNAPLHTLEEVRECESFAGVLAPETVLIDVDNSTDSAKLLDVIEAEDVKCQVRKTTRGMHFYFKNDGRWDKCGAGIMLALGIKADLKIGSSACYAVLKKDGIEREIIYDIFDDEEYDAPPAWLRRVHTNIDLSGEDGRNNALFRYIMPLQEAGLSKDEIKETLRVVNQYIFSEPLSKSEFETITRDEAFETALVPNFFDDKKFLFDQFAHYLIRELHVKRVNGHLHVYRNGVYYSGYRKIENTMIQILPELSDRQRKEVIKYMEVVLEENTPMADANFIAFENGILDVTTGELGPFTPEIVITNRIPWEYNPHAECELVDKTLRKVACDDAEIVSLLEEMAGYCFFRRNELRKAFILTGGARGGKSTYIDLLLRMIGGDNAASLDLAELGDRFRTAQIVGKLVNLGDDIGDDFISNTAVFKKLVSGDRLTAEYKGLDPFEFSNYAKFVFSANTLPRIKDRTGAVLDRLIVIPFNAKFSKDDPDFDPFLKYKLRGRDAVERLIRLGVEGLKRVLTNNAFTTPKVVEKQLKDYDEMNNPILIFFQEIGGSEELCRETVSHWYAQYHEFCLVNQIQSLSKIEFSKQVYKSFPDVETKVIRLNDKVVRVYRKKA